MTVLPVVDRELRVAARRRGTYWSRGVAALLALVVFGLFVAIFTWVPGASGLRSGRMLFSTLSWGCFVFASFAGMFLTSDCLSEEKREGTLGLLFLTDLKGYDVVFGKLLATSLRAVYALLAVVPVLSLTLLLGGVTGKEFWRTVLVLCNTLFFTLAIGIWVSSVNRESMKAMNGTLLACLVFFGIFPVADWTLAGWETSQFVPIFSMASPGYGFVMAGSLPAPDFWLGLTVSHLVGWLFLGLSCRAAPRHWQEGTRTVRANSASNRWRLGSPAGRVAYRRQALDRNPALWLSTRDRSLARMIWIIPALAALVLIWVPLASERGLVTTVVSMAQGFLGLLLFLWLAAHASRFFIESRQTGLLELMLGTSLSVREIVGGHWRSLWSRYLMPAIAVLALMVVAGILQLTEMNKALANTAATSSGGAATPQFNYAAMQVVALATGVLNFITNLVAVTWYGMWAGLTTRRPTWATVKTLVFVLVLPWVALTIVQMVIMIAGSFAFMATSSTVLLWLPSVIVCVLTQIKNGAFVRWSWRRLHDELRSRASREPSPPARRPPILRPPPPALPPTASPPSPP